jgi:hypothetical protein
MYKQNVIYRQVQGFIQMEGDSKNEYEKNISKNNCGIIGSSVVDITDTICTGGWYVI